MRRAEKSDCGEASPSEFKNMQAVNASDQLQYTLKDRQEEANSAMEANGAAWHR